MAVKYLKRIRQNNGQKTKCITVHYPPSSYCVHCNVYLHYPMFTNKDKTVIKILMAKKIIMKKMAWNAVINVTSIIQK